MGKAKPSRFKITTAVVSKMLNNQTRDVDA